MTLEIWLAFVSTVFIFAIIPGPTVIFVVAKAIAHGEKSVIPLALGVLCGDFIAMIVSLLGLGVVLATSATLYIALKWVGVLYLIYLGIKTFQEKPNMVDELATPINISKAQMFQSSSLVTALNPKSIIFFVAFFPQFIVTSSSVLPQFLILMASFSLITLTTITSFAIFASSINHKLASYKARQRLNRISGATLIGAGVFTATIERS
mgnify:CR=1 FL=1